MLRKTAFGLIFIVAASLQPRAAQDFERSYAPVPGRHITIDNEIGNVNVSGYDGEDIKIVARKEGPDQEAIQIIDKSFGPHILLLPMYPKFKSTKTKVDFEIKVPNSNPIFMELKSGSGRIEVKDFNGGLIAESSRGEVRCVNVKGFVFARSVSGRLEAEIKQSQGRSQMRFTSMSGDIRITAPKDLEALIDMKSRSGDLETNFPIDIHQSRYGGNTARGKLGSGTQMLHISSVSGNVTFLKK